MSTETKTHTVADPTESPVEQSWFQKRVIAPVRKHPKITIAVIAGVALIAGAVAFGNDDDSSDLELESSTDESVPETAVA